MKVEELNQLATEMVGDNGRTNVFFVTRQGDVTLITTEFEIAYERWQRLARLRIESALEDRKTGAICTAEMANNEELAPKRWEVRDSSRMFGFRG